jgi:hypothetical protein
MSPSKLRIVTSSASALRPVRRVPAFDYFERWTRWLGEEIAADRIRSVEPHLCELAGAGHSFGVVPASCDVLADPTHPDVARARAFAKVVSAITAAEPASQERPAAA